MLFVGGGFLLFVGGGFLLFVGGGFLLFVEGGFLLPEECLLFPLSSDFLDFFLELLSADDLFRGEAG